MSRGAKTNGFAAAQLGAWFLGAAGTMLVIGGLAWFIIQRTQPAGIDVERAKLRAQYLTETRAEARLALTTSEEIDKARGIWRIPVDQALAMATVIWRDPAAGRSNLLARLQKATAKLPEKVNEYE